MTVAMMEEATTVEVMIQVISTKQVVLFATNLPLSKSLIPGADEPEGTFRT